MKRISDLWFLPVPLPGAISSPALCAPIPLWAVHPLRPVFFPHPTKSPSPGRSQGPLEVGLPAQCPPHPCQIPELQELKIKILQPLLLLAGTQADFAPVTEKQRPRREQDWHSRQPLPEGLLPDLGLLPDSCSLQTVVFSFTPHQNSSSGNVSAP